MQRIEGLTDPELLTWEARAEAAMIAALAATMERVAKIILASMPKTASALVLVGADPPADDGLPPGQPYVSPDDLAAITPAWQEQVALNLLPIAAQVWSSSSGKIYAGMVGATGITDLPTLGSLASEQYLAQAQNTFEQIGNDLWENARGALLDGFQQGESIPELADRLRGAAGVTARTATLVARSQVIEASNAGSIAMARVSGLQMAKEWIATPDLRTRPSHLAADGQQVALNEQFRVGGEFADFPADPSLSPAERYNCRCAIGYVMTSMDTQQAIEDNAPEPPLPNTSTPALSQASGPIARAVAVPPAPTPAAEAPGRPTVRAALLKPKTLKGLTASMKTEMRAITGRDIAVEIPDGMSIITTREYFEGIARGLEQYPEARLRRIGTYLRRDDTYAEATGDTIEMNEFWLTADRRPVVLKALKGDVADWSDTTNGWHTRGADTAIATALHEFAHIIDQGNLGIGKIHSRVLSAVRRRAGVAGVADDDLIAREISAYATSDPFELVAEAFADVQLRGAAASPLSHEIVDIMSAEYRARGFAIRTTAEAADEVEAEALAAEQRAALSRAAPKARLETQRVNAIPRGPAPKPAAAAKELNPNFGTTNDLDKNPAYRDAGKAGERYTPDMGPLPTFAYEENCTNVVLAWDMRMRGFQVEAAPLDVLDKYGRAAGRTYGELDDLVRDSYRLPDGRAHGRSFSSQRWRSFAEIDDEIVREWPEGGRGFITVGKHVFNVIKQNGKAVYIEAQYDANASRVVTTLYKKKYKGSKGIISPTLEEAKVIRLDDLVPVDAIMQTVTVRSAVAETTALTKQTVTQLRALAKERGIVVPPGTRKPEILRLLSEPPPAAETGALEGDAVLRATAVHPVGAQLKAIDRYGGDGGYVINDDLRANAGNLETMTARNRATVEELDAVFDQASIPEPVVLYRKMDLMRGPFGDLANADRDLTGFTWTEDAYSSTSIEQRLTGGRSVQVRIVAPRGTRAISQAALDSDEVLLDRGTSFRVVADRGKNSRFDRVLDVEVIPRAERPLTEAEQLAAERRAMREAARATNRLIESQAATARLLAKVDELVAKKAGRDVIAQELDPALLVPEQLYANASEAVAQSLRTALATGDPAKLRAAITRGQTDKAAGTKIAPIGKAGAKATFDADTMEGVGGIEVAPGAQVTIIRRGSTLTLPDGKVLQLEKAQVTPVVKAPPKIAVKRVTAAERRQQALDDARNTSEALAEVEELLDEGAGTRALLARLESRRKLGVPDDVAARLSAAIQVGDPNMVTEVAAQIADQLGLRKTGQVGDVVPFSRRTQITRSGQPAPASFDGSLVRVVRPGFTMQFEGGTVTVIRPVIEKASPADIAKAKALAPKATRVISGVPHPDVDAPPHLIDSVRAQLKEARPADIEAYERPKISMFYTGRRINLEGLVTFQADHPQAYAQLVQEARAEYSLARTIEHFNIPGTQEEIKAQITARMRTQLAGAKIEVRRGSEATLRDILDRGRMRTQFETKQSGGDYAPARRARFEEALWGYPKKLDPKLRPIYGYLSGSLDESTWPVQQYGPIRIVLKDSVRDRTSFVFGDSLGARVPVSDLESPEWYSYSSFTYTDPTKATDYWTGDFQKNVRYIEAQIHGGVTVDDIEQVIFNTQPSQDTVDALNRAGVSWTLSQ